MSKRKSFIIVLLVVLALIASGVNIRAQEVKTLRVWDTWTEEGDTKGMDQMVADFEAANPGIKITREAMNMDNMRPVLRTALASGTGPDIMYYDTGPGFAGVLADAGLLLPLDDAYKTQKWDHIYAWTKVRTTFGGKIYGIGNELETIGVYFNQDIFDKLGLTAPTTYDEFLALCAKLKDAQYIPIAFADKDKWPAYHMFSIFANNLLGKEKMDTLLFGGASWDDPAVVKAIKLFFVDINKAGYLIPDTNAVAYSDGNALFYNEQAAMDMTGTWQIGETTHNTSFKVGWFFFPSIEGGAVLPPAGLGSGYFVSAKTQYPNEAIAFLSFLFDKKNGRTWIETMSKLPPYAVDTTDFNIPPLLKMVEQAFSEKGTAMGYNIDVLTPDNFNTAMGDGFQAVLGGQKTPEQQAKDLEAAMQEYRSKNK